MTPEAAALIVASIGAAPASLAAWAAIRSSQRSKRTELQVTSPNGKSTARMVAELHKAVFAHINDSDRHRN